MTTNPTQPRWENIERTLSIIYWDDKYTDGQVNSARQKKYDDLVDYVKQTLQADRAHLVEEVLAVLGEFDGFSIERAREKIRALLRKTP